MKLILSLSIFSLVLLTTFNNCGKVELRSQSSTPSPVSGASEKINYISIPELPEQQLRAVFLLDMSRSMMAGPCADSVDVMVQGMKSVPDCVAPSGVDNMGNRFKIIRDWTDQVQGAISKGIISETQVKLMLVPFTGGRQDDVLNILTLNWPGRKGFATLGEFISALNRLEALWVVATTPINKSPIYPPYIPTSDQNTEVIKSRTQALLYFGTSVPGPRLDNINTAVANELETLKAADLTRAAQFEVVFISDGVAKPRPDHMVSIIEFIWKIKIYGQGSRSYCTDPPNWNYQSGDPCFQFAYETTSFNSCVAACKAESTAYAETGVKPTVYSPTCKPECFSALESFEFNPGGSSGIPFTAGTRLFWGNWEDNTHSKLFFRFATLLNVFRRNSDTRYRFSFIRLDSDIKAFEVQPIELDPTKNWIKKAEQVYAKGHRFSPPQKDSTSPFSLFMSLKNNERYQVSQIFAINLNARVNSFGALEIDSDADGLPDVLETMHGFNLSNPRSDEACLDGIKHMMGGCITVGCDANLDNDGDGLNQCEERTIGTDTQDFDTDGDGIPDGYEILFGLNALSSDRLKTAGDGVSNLVHFQRGAVSEVDLKNIPTDRLIQFIADLRDQKMITDTHGRSINSPGYYFELKNIPLVSTSNSTDSFDLYRSATKTQADISTLKTIGGNHNAGENRIMFMMRIDSLDNPGDSFWVHMEQKLSYSPDKAQEIIINYDDFKILNVIDPLGEVK